MIISPPHKLEKIARALRIIRDKGARDQPTQRLRQLQLREFVLSGMHRIGTVHPECMLEDPEQAEERGFRFAIYKTRTVAHRTRRVTQRDVRPTEPNRLDLIQCNVTGWQFENAERLPRFFKFNRKTTCAREGNGVEEINRRPPARQFSNDLFGMHIPGADAVHHEDFIP